MKCPNDETTLVMSDRQGIEIDYCPQCRGVWLDRGELDKIIDRSAPTTHTEVRKEVRHEQPRSGESYGHHSSYHKKHRKESFLGDLFDF